MQSGKSTGTSNVVGQRSSIGQYWGRTSYTSNAYSNYYLVAITQRVSHYSSYGFLSKDTHLTIRCLAQ